MKKFWLNIQLALRDARANLFHTLLSVLGVVIGVAALVGILSLIDGLEKYANEQISSTTSLEGIVLTTNVNERVDNVSIRKDDFAYFNYDSFLDLAEKTDLISAKYMRYRESGYLNEADTSKIGTLFSGIIDTWNDDIELLEGSFINESNLKSKDSVIVLNHFVAKELSGDKEFSNLINETVSYRGNEYRVVGIIKSRGDGNEVYVPITLISEKQLQSRPPTCYLMANTVADIPIIKESINDWLKVNFKEKNKDINIVTNEFRVEQANKAFMVFRIIMGLIVGISVLVGGVGVMNVLLISVNERKAEIGVRKAVGAKPRDIVRQFLTESIAISSIGSILGLLIGILFTLIAVPIVKHFTEVPFQAAFTLNTLLTISIVAILVGVVFGTYPAMKASKLDPVEAIRSE